MELIYQYLKSSNAAQALASTTIVHRLLARLILCINQIHAIGEDKWHHHGECVVCHLLSEEGKIFNSYVNPEKKGP